MILLKELKKSIPLPVSALHCNMMKPAAKELKDFMADFDFRDPKIPLVSNVSAKAEHLSDEIKSTN